MKLRILAALISLVLMVAPAWSWPTVYPTGTTVYLPDKAENGYTLVAPMAVGHIDFSPVSLINMRGDVVHKWEVPFAALSSRLLPNGNLLSVVTNPTEAPNRAGFGKFWIGGAAGTIIETTWEGKTVFRHDDLNMHHDVVKLPNGHYLYLAWEQVPKALQMKIRGGTKGTTFPGGVMFNDYLVEVDAQGKTVWEWHANDHLDPDIDIIGPLYDRGEWCHCNSVSILANGNILLASRQTDTIMIVDRRTSKIIWRWGSRAYLDKASGQIEYRRGDNILGGPHNAAEIPPGLPGAGNIICFDNGLYDAVSRVVEVNPATRKLVWHSGQPQWGRRSFSWFLGSAQRLPNGNTLICEGANGRLTQETAKNELVWEYVNPFIPTPKLNGAMLKAYQYAADYCPQFKQLPSATGTAIVPPIAQFLPIPGEMHPDLIPLPLALGALAALTLLLALLIWRKRSKKNRADN